MILATTLNPISLDYNDPRMLELIHHSDSSIEVNLVDDWFSPCDSESQLDCDDIGMLGEDTSTASMARLAVA